MQDLILIQVSKQEFKEMIRTFITEALKEQSPGDDMSSSDKLMSTIEASVFLNLAVQTIYGMTSKNLIPHIKRGKKLYFSKAELTAWLKEGKQKTVSEFMEQANKY